MVRVGSLDELGEKRALGVRLARGRHGQPRFGLVVLGPKGEPCGYMNLCKHLPVPIDSLSGDFLDEEGFLVCRTHGARYRVEDGYCIDGPCEGESLDALEVVVEGTDLFVVDPADSAAR